MKSPTPEQVDLALARLGKPGASAYFFDRLNNPLWIEPLAKKGFFKRPPPAERIPEQGSVAFPDWPELRYLQRMADQAPEVVGCIATQIPDTDNARVRQTLAALGTKLGLPAARRLGSRFGGWLDEPLMRAHFGEPFAQFIGHIARLGDWKAAIGIAKHLFPVPTESDVGERWQVPDAWHFERYLTFCVPDLAKGDSLSTLDFLVELLRSSTQKRASSPADDYSYIWRRDIAKANFSAKQVRDVLVDAVRDLALELARQPAVGVEAICGRLLATRQPLLIRISLYVASKAAGPVDRVVGVLLGDIDLVDRKNTQAEYGMLLEAMYLRLPVAEQERVVHLLTGTDFLQAIPEPTRTGLDAGRRLRYSKAFERDRLSAFGSSLPESLRHRLAQLQEEIGRPTPEVSGVTSLVAASPLSTDQVQAMSVDDLLKFISGWTASSGLGEPTVESLAQQLQIAARIRAAEFSAQAEKWIGQDPTYVRWIVMGLTDAITNKGRIEDWTSLLTLMNWAINQSDPPDAEIPDRWSGRDIGWSHVRQSIARLIERALADDTSGVLGADLTEVWRVVDRLLQDPDPVPGPPTAVEDEDGNAALTTSINSTRGVATEALFRYLWRIHPNDVTSGPLTFEATPQIRRALERALQDSHPALRSVLGQWLLTLFHFDFNWTAARIDEILPEQSDRRRFFNTGWYTFVEYSGPYDPAFEVLRAKYVLAIEQIEPDAEDSNKRLGEYGLGRHLASYYWRGIGIQGSFDLLIAFLDRCSATAAAETIAFIGRGLQEVGPIPPDTLERWTKLWDTLARTPTERSELKTREMRRRFSEWFSSPHLNEEWSLGALEACLTSGAGLVESEGVVTRLTSLAGKYPAAVARCAALLVLDDQQLLLPTLWQRELTVLLSTLLQNPDPAIRETTEGIINRLVESGSLFARDIVRTHQ